ncbi:hypothetical protein ET33_07955 [Paenibacillus tyrfis]|uniref:Uncharacterized protein n=1 Tax=Paenibacillus tyrfis TaxID=1501230 RepID=A0A081P1T7_9BACL|nr:YhjD/YihY/BrkB family envelope integrity protein [Paenibacillus tyrfis]KEQ24660.1 hypothetical protein ET33_07955 [Paenibacillus tyrfis]
MARTVEPKDRECASFDETGFDRGTRTFFGRRLLAALWSASNGISAVIKALNKAYDEEESRPSWKVKGIAVSLYVILAVVILLPLCC